MELKKIFNKYIRVLKLLKKPTKEEFIAGIKIAGMGLLLVGFIGFIIWLFFINVLKIGL